MFGIVLVALLNIGLETNVLFLDCPQLQDQILLVPDVLSGQFKLALVKSSLKVGSDLIPDGLRAFSGEVAIQVVARFSNTVDLLFEVGVFGENDVIASLELLNLVLLILCGLL